MTGKVNSVVNKFRNLKNVCFQGSTLMEQLTWFIGSIPFLDRVGFKGPNEVAFSFFADDFEGRILLVVFDVGDGVWKGVLVSLNASSVFINTIEATSMVRNWYPDMALAKNKNKNTTYIELSKIFTANFS